MDYSINHENILTTTFLLSSPHLTVRHITVNSIIVVIVNESHENISNDRESKDPPFVFK